MPESRCRYEKQCTAYLAVGLRGAIIHLPHLETTCVSDRAAREDCVLYKNLAETTINRVEELREMEILYNPWYR